MPDLLMMYSSSNSVLPYRAFAELPAERHLAVRFYGDGFACIRTFRQASDHQVDRHVLIRFRDLCIHALAVSWSTCESDVNRVGRNQRPGFPGLGLRCDQVIARREQWWTGSAVASRSAQPVGTTGAGNATGAGSAGSAGSAGMCGRAARRSMAAATARSSSGSRGQGCRQTENRAPVRDDLRVRLVSHAQSYRVAASLAVFISPEKYGPQFSSSASFHLDVTDSRYPSPVLLSYDSSQGPPEDPLPKSHPVIE